MRGRGQAGCAVHHCTMSARESSRRMEAVRLMDMARRGGEEERGDAPPSYAVQEEVPEPELDGTWRTQPGKSRGCLAYGGSEDPMLARRSPGGSPTNPVCSGRLC